MLTSVIAGILCGTVLLAQDLTTLAPWSAKVKLDVSAEPKSFHDEIESYLARELRSLGDVSVVDEKEEYRIEVVAIQEQFRSGRSASVAISVVVNRPWNWSMFEGFLSGVSEQNKKFLEGFQDLALQLYHHLYSGNMDDVPDICRKIVVELDARSFEPGRKDYRQWTDQMRAKKAIQE